MNSRTKKTDSNEAWFKLITLAVAGRPTLPKRLRRPIARFKRNELRALYACAGMVYVVRKKRKKAQ